MVKMRPIKIQLITAPGCQKCVAAKQAVLDTINQVRNDYPIEVEEVDALEHPEMVAQHGILATPALIINGHLAFVGRVQASSLRDTLTTLV